MNAVLRRLIKDIPQAIEKQPALTPAGTSVFLWDVPPGATMAKMMIQRKGADCRFDFTLEAFDGKDWIIDGIGGRDSTDDPSDVNETGTGWVGQAAQLRFTIVSSKDAVFGVSIGFS